jgi:hypothetical protein
MQLTDTASFYTLLNSLIAGAEQRGLDRHQLANMLKPVVYPDDEEFDTQAAAIICKRSPSTLERWRSKGLGPVYFKDSFGCVTYTGRTLREFEEQKEPVYQSQKMQDAK